MNNLQRYILIPVLSTVFLTACQNNSQDEKIKKLEQEVSQLDSERQATADRAIVDSTISSPSDGPASGSVGVNKFRAFEFRMYANHDSLNHPWIETNAFVTINLDGDKIRTYIPGKGQEDNIDLVKQESNFNDREGNNFSIYDAVNSGDENCMVIIEALDNSSDGAIVDMSVVDANFTTEFRLKSGW